MAKKMEKIQETKTQKTTNITKETAKEVANMKKTNEIVRPNFTSETSIQTISDYAKSIIQSAKDTKDPAYAWAIVELLSDYPELLEHKIKTPQTRRDNISYIEGLRNIPEVRRLKKIAYAKISKSKDKPEAVERYRKEVEAADKLLNSLLAEVEAAEVPWQKALELGEDKAAAFNYFLLSKDGYKDKIDEAVKELAKKKSLTNAQVKAELQTTKVSIPQEVPEELKEAMAERIKRGDQLVQTVAKKAAFLKKLTA